MHLLFSTMKLVCFDIGDVRVGVAASDPFMSMALPQKTYWRKNFAADIKNLAKIAADLGATTIVCGLPLNLDGSVSEQAKLTLSFIEALKAETEIPVVTEDERFTTKLATRDLISASVRRAERKNYVDSVAASYILESYMQKLNSTN